MISKELQKIQMDFFCNDCPRNCGVKRVSDSPSGVCRSPSLPSLARCAPHFGEEPCISGTRGSGAIFFTGCNLRCVFCQNHEISRGLSGTAVSVERLRDIMRSLEDQGVHNINLVTGSHYTRAIAQALEGLNLSIPVVWNSSGYDSVESLKRLEGLVQIYMPDYKYTRSEHARRYSAAVDYPEVAEAAIKEMYRQRGPYIMDKNGMMLSGLLVRHLILPGSEDSAMDVIDFIADEFPKGSVLFSLMSQYTPMPGLEAFPELQQPISSETAANMRHYMLSRGIRDGYWQDVSSATGELIPDFDGSGV